MNKIFSTCLYDISRFNRDCAEVPLKGVFNYWIKSPSISLIQRGRSQLRPPMQVRSGFEVPINKGGNRGLCFLSVALLLAVGAGCARMGAPQGGPEDKDPPRIEAVSPTPDSTGVPQATRVRLVFSEDVQRQEAERLISLAPYRGRLFFEWEGSTVKLRPAEPLKADITWRVRIGPGLTDMHRVKSDSSFSSYFSTGTRFSPGRITGMVTYRDSLVREVLLRAVPAADTSLAFEVSSDSTGRYVLPYLPLGEFSLSAFRDRNRNNRFDYTRDEGADTVLSLGPEPLQIDFRLILADTTAPSIVSVTVPDSLSLALAFDDLIDSAQAFTPDMFELRRGDSTGIVVEVSSAALDSADHHRVILHLSEPLVTEERYWLRVREVVNEAGMEIRSGRGSRTFTRNKARAPPKPTPPPGDRRR